MTAVKQAMETLLLTAKQAAQLLNVSERTLWTWSKRGIAPVIRLGGTVRYSRDQLESWIAAGCPSNPIK